MPKVTLVSAITADASLLMKLKILVGTMTNTAQLVAQEIELTLGDDDTVVNVDKLCAQSPRLALVRSLANERKFFHWELEFIALFGHGYRRQQVMLAAHRETSGLAREVTAGTQQ